MITFNELLERAKSELIAIHTPTEEQAKTLLKALDENGYVWCGGDKLTTTTRYGNYKENTCYNFTPDFSPILNKKIMYGSLGFYQDEGYTVIEFEDIDFAEKTTNQKQSSVNKSPSGLFLFVGYSVCFADGK